MQHSKDRGREGSDIDSAFGDPAFAPLKARGAPFTILRSDTGTVLWANAAAAEHWSAENADALSRILFGPDGHHGWLDGLVRGLVPDRAPRLARAGLTRGFGMRAHTALIRAWTASDGTPLIGVAVPDAAVEPAADPEAWRRTAWRPEAEALSREPAAAACDAAAHPRTEADPSSNGETLARRSQLAVLRDRLSRAVDGAAALRLLWRTDADDIVVAIDGATFARLGSPLRFDGSALPDAVAPFDPEGAERLRSALATRATWAGISVEVPVADAAATLPVAFSGSPVLGPERSFTGYRGFGTIDLGRLALAPHRVSVRGDEEPEAAPLPAEPSEGDPIAEDMSLDNDQAPVPPPEPVQAAPMERLDGSRPAANVVQLRAFQGLVSARFGAVPAHAEAQREVPAALPQDSGEAALEPGSDDVPDPAETGPLSDQLAFLALGEALRARIGEPVAAEPAERPETGPSPARPPALDEPASRLLDRLPIAVLAIVAGRPVYANAAAALRLGYAEPQALLEAGEATVVSSAGADRIELRDAEGRTVTTAARCVDVPWAGVSATLWLLADRDGGAAEDTGRPAEPALPEDGASGDERPVDLIDRVDDAVALLDAAGRLRRLNQRGEAWFGRAEPEAAPARVFTDLLAPESRAIALALLGEVRNQREGLGAPPLRRDVMARTGEGATMPMLLTLGRLGGSGFYATLRDLSALKRAETDRARTESDRARAAGRLPDLLAKVSHEIRTPLGSILGFAEVMIDERFGPLGNPRYKDYLKDIHASGAQVVALVDDLLDLSRIEAGQLDLDVAALDVNRVVAEAVAQMQPEAHRERVIMRTSLAGRIPPVLADERSARQIVKNLLSNAVKFNEPGGQVIVSTTLGEAGAVLLRVRDTGVGMNDEEIAAALEPLGGLPASSPANGNGLGLPLTRALVGANGASMTIRSRPREGTLVEVAFAPAEPGEARRPA